MVRSLWSLSLFSGSCDKNEIEGEWLDDAEKVFMVDVEFVTKLLNSNRDETQVTDDNIPTQFQYEEATPGTEQEKWLHFYKKLTRAIKPTTQPWSLPR